MGHKRMTSKKINGFKLQRHRKVIRITCTAKYSRGRPSPTDKGWYSIGNTPVKFEHYQSLNMGMFNLRAIHGSSVIHGLGAKEEDE